LVRHNVFYYHELMGRIRKSIEEESFDQLREEIQTTYKS